MSFIIRDVRIFTGEETIEEGFIAIVDGKIKSIGLASDIPNPPNPRIISKPGHTLLPGFIDAYIHASKNDPISLQQSLRFGVTTVCDMHNEMPYVKAQHALTLLPDTADYKTAGIPVTIENGWPSPVVIAHDKTSETAAKIATWPRLKTKEDVSEYLDMNERQCKPDYIKLMHKSGKAIGASFERPSKELQKIIIDAAHEKGYLTVAHALALEDAVEVLRAGIDGLTHTCCDQALTEELVQAYKESGAWLNPTLAAIGSLTKEGKVIQEKFAHDKRVGDLLRKWEGEWTCQCMGMAIESSKQEFAFEIVRRLREEGIDIVCGSDAAAPTLGTAWGLSLHYELYLFVKHTGMTPEEAIRSATSTTAKRFRFNDRGRLAEGLKADLVLVEGNPLADIDATLNLRGVWRDGVLCSVYKTKL